MINYETILSNYDDRLTLMQWLKKVEAALMAAALASVTITQPSDDTAVFNFVFADGTSVSSPSLNLPRGLQGEQGTQGEQGAQGVGVSNVTINSNSHLIVTLTNGVEIDAGYIETGSGIVVDTELSPTSTNPVENRVIYNVVTTAQNTISALGGRVTTAEGNISALDTRVTTAEGKITTAEGNIRALDTRVTTAEGAITTLQNDKLEEVTASDVDSEAATSGQVLTANGSGGAAWSTPQGGGGGTQLYRHFVTLLGDDASDFNNAKLIVITNSSSQLAFDENGTISSNGNIISAHCDSISSKTSEGVHVYLSLVVGMNLQDEIIDGLICQDQHDNSIQSIYIGAPNFSTLTDVVTAL